MNKSGVNVFSCLQILFLAFILLSFGYCSGKARAEKIDRTDFNKEIAIEKAVLKAKEEEETANRLSEMWKNMHLEQSHKIIEKSINLHDRVENIRINIGDMSNSVIDDSLFHIGLDILNLMQLE